jgi:hypothetical protein
MKLFTLGSGIPNRHGGVHSRAAIPGERPKDDTPGLLAAALELTALDYAAASLAGIGAGAEGAGTAPRSEAAGAVWGRSRVATP